MAEVGCLKDGNFQNLEVSGNVSVNTALIGNGKPSLFGLPNAAVVTGATNTYVHGININNFTGAAAQVTTLPAARPGVVCVHAQSVDTTGGVNTLTFDLAGTDVFETGSVIQSTAAAAIIFDTSTAGETQLVYTPANATTNILTIGSKIYFTCINTGKWHISTDLAVDPLAVTGTFAFAA